MGDAPKDKTKTAVGSKKQHDNYSRAYFSVPTTGVKKEIRKKKGVTKKLKREKAGGGQASQDKAKIIVGWKKQHGYNLQCCDSVPFTGVKKE